LSPVPRPEDPESVVAQAENETAYRQLLVYSFLAILLPTEDLENGCLTALVGQIFSELIIRNAVASRLSEPWLVWELLIIAARTAGRRKTDEAGGSLKPSSSPSGHCRRGYSLQALFWTAIQWCFLGISFIRATIAILVTARSLPPRASHAPASKGSGRIEISRASAPESRNRETLPAKTPVVAFRCWSSISNLAETHIRMPWLSGAFSMLQWVAIAGPALIADVNRKLDR